MRGYFDCTNPMNDESYWQLVRDYLIEKIQVTISHNGRQLYLVADLELQNFKLR